jgi:hypothetical protein
LKMRIQNNSIRLRLTRTEVDQVCRDGNARAAISFPGGARLDYAVEASDSARPEVRFDETAIVVHVPGPLLRQWAESEEVSIRGEQALGDGDELSILVEKDFACLTPRAGEDESEMFPHPLKGEANC